MKPDESIEVVLNALRTSDPPQGYEGRIQQALLQAQQEQHHAFFNSSLVDRHPERSAAKPKDLLFFLFTKMRGAPVLAATCAAIAIVAISMRVPRSIHPAQAPGTRTIAHEEALSLQPLSTVHASKTSESHSARHTSKPAEQSSVPSQPAHEETAVLTHEYIPEPPLPLTEQERLVIRMMHRDNSPQLAEYTPDARAQQLHEDAEEYRKYFASQPLDGQPLYVQPIYHQKISGGSQ
jgi:hypothetical protein